jgi:hypothetical protein
MSLQLDFLDSPPSAHLGNKENEKIRTLIHKKTSILFHRSMLLLNSNPWKVQTPCHCSWTSLTVSGEQIKREDKNTNPQKDKYPVSSINAFTQFESLEIFSPEKDK